MKMERLIGIAVVVGAVALFAGVPLGTVFIGAVFLACPLMMLFMVHGAEGGHPAAHAEPSEHDASVDASGIRK